MNEAEKAQALAFTLYTQDIAIIDGADTYDAGRSATLRRIIREWDDWHRRTLIDTPAQYVTATIGDDRA